MAKAQDQSETVRPFTTKEVLKLETSELWGAAEAEEIWDDKAADGKTPVRRYREAMLARGQAALCLSGGGIRSAAFALGVVQALARKNLLPCFHYLSTVSGGGYLGSFLSRWVEEEKKKNEAQTDPATPKLTDHQVLLKIQDALAGRGPDNTVEPAPIRWLRENSNFITPRVGIASADTWTAIATSVRNILINWLVFGPALLVVTAFPNLGAALFVVASGWFGMLCLIVGFLLAGYGGFQGAFNLPSHLVGTGRGKDERYVFLHVVLPATAGAAALAAGVAPDLLLAPESSVLGLSSFPVLIPLTGRPAADQALGLLLVLTLIAFLGGYVVAWIAAARVESSGGVILPAELEALRQSNSKGFQRNLVLWGVGSLLAAFLYIWGLSIVPRIPCPPGSNACGLRVDVLATFAVFWGVLAQLTVITVFVAFRRYEPDQKVLPDLDREWLARLSAQKIRVALAWTLFAAATLLFWHVLVWLYNNGMPLPKKDEGQSSFGAILHWVTGIIGTVFGVAAAFGGKASTDKDAIWLKKLFASPFFVALATFVSLIFLFLVLGRIEFAFAEWLLQHLPITGSWSMVVGHITVILVTGFVLWVTSKYINVNRFSLNGMYRNRLTRAFMAAARIKRPDKDAFTGFAPSDNIRLHALKAIGPDGGRVLMPVVNVALNLVSGSRLAWQERKAESFIFTPVACGSPGLCEDPLTGQGHGRYIPTGIYAGNEPDLGLAGGEVSLLLEHHHEPDDVEPERGVSLATAIAISGAAASPSMGYHSSPATAFLMTLFNVRLGAWLPNPGWRPRASMWTRFRMRLDTWLPKRWRQHANGGLRVATPVQASRADEPAELPKDVMMRSAPQNALLPLLFEMLGLTDDTKAAVYLSDGGHFENLGLYEMVRRRCRYIVVSDAGCDPEAGFEDLGGAIRKVRIDFGVDIDIDTARIVAREKWEKASTFFAVGTIRYPEGVEGQLLYLKPGFPAKIPTDVRAYALKSKSFPHESTADQWFSESQFESYRKLGETLAGWLGGKGQDYAPATLEQFFRDIRNDVN